MAYFGDYTIKQFELLDGKIVTIDGVECVIKHRSSAAIYPYAHISHTLFANATEKGKESAHYKAVKKQLKDDWSTDLAEDYETRWSLICDLGLVEEMAAFAKTLPPVEPFDIAKVLPSH